MRPQTLAQWLSAGAPFVAYIFSASAFAYWLDSGEFVAAAVDLDIAHPPGHPLSGLYGRAFCMLPFGSLSFRVALGQATATALASLMMCRATAAALSGLGLAARAQWSLALCGAWLSAFSYGVWFQAARPEVYALQSLCVAWLLERLQAGAVSPQTSHARPLIAAALALGLALTNHHLIALLLAPAFIPALVAAISARAFRSLTAAFAAGALGLGVYAYLPLRAAAGPPANLGSPVDLERFAWVVSARGYARDMGTSEVQPLTTRIVDVFALLFEDLHLLPLLLALVGLYFMLRIPSTRRAGVITGLALAADAGARAWLGPVRANPDILGYLAPSYWAVGSLAACALGALSWLADREWPNGATWIARLSPLAPACALLLLPGSWQRASLAEFSATDSFDDLRLRELPPRSVVISSSPQSVFRAFELSAVEQVRPDVVQLPLPFLRYPGMREAVVRREPALAGIADAYLGAHDHLQLAPLLALSRQRPVFVELDTRVDPKLYAFLRPQGLLVSVTADPQRISHEALQRALSVPDARLMARLGGQRTETETARQLLWVHYLNAVQLGALGARDLARSELERARAAAPGEARVQALQSALADPKPLEPAAFLSF